MGDEFSLLERALAEIDVEISVTEERLADLRLQRRGAEAFLRRLAAMQDARGQVARPREAEPPGDSPSPTAGQGYTELVASILAEEPSGMQLTVVEQRLRELGRSLTGEQVRSAVTYLKRKGEAENVARGVWRRVARPNTPEAVGIPASAGLPTSSASSREEETNNNGTPTLDHHNTSLWQGDRDDHRGAPMMGAAD